jgi:hypothetical protein
MGGGIGGRDRVGGALARAFRRPVGRPSRSIASIEKEYDDVCRLVDVLRGNVDIIEDLLSKKSEPSNKASLRDQLTKAKAGLRAAEKKKTRLGRVRRAKGRGNAKLVSCTCSFFWYFFQLIITIVVLYIYVFLLLSFQ